MSESMDLATDITLRRARDLLTANVMWAYTIESVRAGVPMTLQLMNDIGDGVSTGELPDLSLVLPRPASQLVAV